MQMRWLVAGGGWLAICSIMACTQQVMGYPIELAIFGRESRAMPAREDLLAPLEAPERPDHFRNLDELNDYLSQLRKYYTILGRPR